MKLKVKLSVPLLLFIAGGFCFLLWFFLRHKILLAGGGITRVAAYSFVLADNYKTKTPIPTRGGLMTHDKNPHWYKAVYGFMAFLGLFFLFVVLALNIFGTR